MKRLILAAILCALPASAAYTATYKITIAHGQVGGSNLTNYPVTVSTGNNATLSTVALANLHSVANGGAVTSASGFDIVLTADQQGLSVLPFERVFWSATSGVTELHVMLTSVSATVDPVLYLQVGNSAIITDQSTPTATWNANYLAVYHYPNGSSLTAADSTSNNKTGTITAATATTGQIDGGAAFNGSTAAIVTASTGLYDVAALSLEGWFNATSSGGNNFIIGISSNAATRYVATLDTGADGIGVFDGGSNYKVFLATVSLNAWHHVLVYTTGSNTTVYLDGSSLGTQAVSQGATANLPLFAGGVTGARFPGSIDEFRVANASLIPFVTADFNSQKAGSTFFTAIVAPPPDFNCTGTFSGPISYTSSTLTCTKTTGTWGAGNTVTIADGAQGGTIVPAPGSSGVSTATTGNLTGLSSFTYTYTPAVVSASISLAYSNNYAAQNGFTNFYASTAVTLTFTGCPSSGSLLAASTTCTITLGGATFDGAHPVTLSDSANLGTFTPSVGSPGISTVTVTPPSGTTFTFTYTAQSIGAKAWAITNPSGFTNPPNNAYAVTSPDPCTMTAKATGNWNAAGTWTASGGGCAHTTPRSGDTISITGFHVTIPSAYAAYAGTCPANTTYADITLGNSAWLETASTGLLWLCGNGALTATNTGTSTPTGATFQIDTGGAFYMDGNNAHAYVVSSGNQRAENLYKVGTLGDICTAATPSTSYSCPTVGMLGVNVGGGNPIAISGGAANAMTFQLYGALYKNCGSASVPCIEYGAEATTNGYANAGILDVQGIIMDNTGNISGLGNSTDSTVSKITVKHNKFLNDLSGFWSLAVGSAGTFTNPCEFYDNYFDGAVLVGGNNQWGGCKFDGSAFPQAIGSGQVAAPWGAFRGNLYVGSLNFLLVAPVFSSNYWLYLGTPPGSIHFSVWGNANVRVFGNLYDSQDPASAEGHLIADPASSPSFTLTMINNLSLIGLSGITTGNPMIWAIPNGTSQGVAYMDHNGTYGQCFIACHVFFGHPDGGGGGLWPNNQVLRSFRSNMSWAPATGQYNWPLANFGSTAALDPGGSIYAPGIAYNNNFNMIANTQFGPGVNSNCNPSSTYPSKYGTCNSGAGLGGHDLAVDPKMIDSSRNAFKWAAIRGQAATFAGLKIVLQQCQDVAFCLQAMITYVRQGYQPGNLGLKGQANDGSIVGVTGTLGSGYTGTCGVTFAVQDTDDIGTGALATCTFPGGIPKVVITNGGTNYRVLTPAVATIVCGGCSPGTPASLNALVSPSDIGPVQMFSLPSAQ